MIGWEWFCLLSIREPNERAWGSREMLDISQNNGQGQWLIQTVWLVWCSQWRICPLYGKEVEKCSCCLVRSQCDDGDFSPILNSLVISWRRMREKKLVKSMHMKRRLSCDVGMLLKCVKTVVRSAMDKAHLRQVGWEQDLRQPYSVRWTNFELRISLIKE